MANDYPRILALRSKTGCRQYNFRSLEECFAFFRKKCYWMETLTIIEFDENTRREIRRFTHRNEWSD